MRSRANRHAVLVPIAVLALTGGPIPSLAACGRAAEPTEVRSFAGADSLDAYIARALDTVGVVPGLSIAVVQGEEVVYLAGFGKRDAEADLPMGPGTVSYIASSTKSFTGLASALLAEEGRLDLDAPLGTYLEGFEFEAERLSADSITLRELLTHTHGFENDPVVVRTAYTGDHTPQELRRVLAEESVPTEPGFEYGNIGYVVMSLVIDEVTGKSWRDVLAERIFAPLGMERTSAYVSRARREAWPIAAPYFGAGPDGLERRPFWKSDETMHAAGGLLTTAADLARWLEAQINRGRVDGEQLLPAAVVAETHRKQAELDADFWRFHRHGYGLGWYVADYEGETLLHHFGSFPGYRAHISFMPQHDLGVAVLINELPGGIFLPDAVAAYAYELALGDPGLAEKGAGMLAELSERLQGVRDAVREDRERRAGRPQELPRPLEAYTGTFRSSALGQLELFRRSDGLHARVGGMRSDVEVFDHEREMLRIEIAGGGQVVRFFFPEGASGEEPADSVALGGHVWLRVR